MLRRRLCASYDVQAPASRNIIDSSDESVFETAERQGETVSGQFRNRCVISSPVAGWPRAERLKRQEPPAPAHLVKRRSRRSANEGIKAGSGLVELLVRSRARLWPADSTQVSMTVVLLASGSLIIHGHDYSLSLCTTSFIHLLLHHNAFPLQIQ